MNSPCNKHTLGHYFFHILPRAIIRDLIFREMLDLKDIARLEVAAAIHRLHDEEKVRALAYMYDYIVCSNNKLISLVL
jgi:hypothetical protein